MILTIDGFDLLPFVAAGEYTVTRNDLEGPNTGRTMDGILHRDKLAHSPRKIETQLIPLSREEWENIEHNVLRGKTWLTLQFEDFGRIATAKMYSSSFNGTISTITGKRIGATVNFIEE